MNKKKKVFSLYLREDLLEKMRVVSERDGSTIAHQINRAVDLQLSRDERFREKIKQNGQSDVPEDLIDCIKDFA